MAHQLHADQGAARNAARIWLHAFRLDAGDPECARTESDLAIIVDQLATERVEILTGMLPHTHQVAAAIRAGTVQVLRRDIEAPRLQDVIDLLRLISTHNRIARTRELRMRAPGFWFRGEQRRIHPVMPIQHLERLSGHSEAGLRQMLPLLATDGAIRILRDPEGFAGVLLVDGYVDDLQIRRFLRC